MLSTAHLHFAASPSPPSRYPTSTACPAHHCSYPPGMQHSGWKIQLYTRPPQDQCVLPMHQSRSATPTQSHPLSYCQLGSTISPYIQFVNILDVSLTESTWALELLCRYLEFKRSTTSKNSLTHKALKDYFTHHSGCCHTDHHSIAEKIIHHFE